MERIVVKNPATYMHVTTADSAVNLLTNTKNDDNFQR